MTYEQADELLHNNDWAKWSDARELLLIAAGLGAAAERERCAQQLERLGQHELAYCLRNYR